jgi:hypothetical protein
MGMGFLTDMFFLHEYEFGQVIPGEFLSIVISNTELPRKAERSTASRIPSDDDWTARTVSMIL